MTTPSTAGLPAMFDRFCALSTFWQRANTPADLTAREHTEYLALLRDIPESLRRLAAFAELGTDALMQRAAEARKTAICIGRGNDGCGHVGGVSGDTCPKCGGMLLEQRHIAIADEAQRNFEARKPAQEWRELKEGEMIMEGDELRDSDNVWKLARHSIGESVGWDRKILPPELRYRRKVVSATQPSPGTEKREDGQVPVDCGPILRPIETAPKDGTWIILAGPSGHVTTPFRFEAARWYAEYRPRNPWQTHSNDAFTDGGEPPTHWMPLPRLP